MKRGGTGVRIRDRAHDHAFGLRRFAPVVVKPLQHQLLVRYMTDQSERSGADDQVVEITFFVEIVRVEDGR